LAVAVAEVLVDTTEMHRLLLEVAVAVAAVVVGK
jgi:hypothetical protein